MATVEGEGTEEAHGVPPVLRGWRGDRFFGWRPGLSVAEQRRVIWQYNRSEPYVDTILALHREIAAPPAQPAPRKRRR